MRIIFMGTPAFAVESLKALVEHQYNIVAVVTATDKYGGRGGKTLIESPVKKYALSMGITVLQPKNLKAESFVHEMKSLKTDLQIVVAFRMLPEVIWNMPPLGTYNLHGSLLPKYRGAAPINWAIINGDEETGVTTFKLKHEIDTGNMVLQKKMPIHEDDDAGIVHDRMMQLGAEAILETVKLIADNAVQFTPQNNEKATKAPKIYPETCQINWHQSTDKIYNFIRGLSPYPGAWTTLDEKTLKIYKAARDTQDHSSPCGTIRTDNKHYLAIATNDGWIYLKELKLAGKKQMDIVSFLNGYKIDTVQIK